MWPYAKKGLKKGDYKETQPPLMTDAPRPSPRDTGKDGEKRGRFCIRTAYEVFNAKDTSPLGIEGILEGRFIRPGAEIHRIEDPAQ